MQSEQLSEFLAILWASGSLLPGELYAASERLKAREIFEAQHTAHVAVESELTAAIQNPVITTIMLSSDIITMSDIVINRQEPLTLDLNGYKIASLRANASAIDLQTGDLTITGKGSIVANGASSSGVRIKGAMTAENVHYASLLLDKEVTLYAPHAHGIYLAANFQAAYGVKIILQGKIIARDGIGVNQLIRGQGEHIPQITIADDAVIEVDTEDGVALSAAGFAKWQVGAAKISGATGASVKSGCLDFTNTKLTATGELRSPSGWDDTVGVGAVIQIEESDEYAGDIYLQIDGGEYTSHQSYLAAKYGSAATLRRLEIKAGTFTVASGVFYGFVPNTDSDKQTIAVSGGSFSAQSVTELSDYLAKGFYLESNRLTGLIEVINPNPPEAQIDPVEQLALECTALENLMIHARTYLDKEYIGDELGEWQDAANKVVGTIRRAVKAGEKLLQEGKQVALEQVLRLEKRIKNAIRNIEKIADELRGEMLSVLTTAQELDPHEYSAYSYNALKDAIIAALALTAQPAASLNQLYSVFCDLQLNIDLLEEPEDELDIALSAPIVPPPLPPIPTTTNLEVIEPEINTGEMQRIMELGASVILAALDQSLSDTLMPTISTSLELAEPPIEAEAIIDEEKVASSDLPVDSYLAPETTEDELAMAALNDARSSLYLMIDAVRDLALKDYQAEYAEQFGELQVAIVKAQAILQKPNAILPEILDAMDEVKFATAGLQLEAEQPPVTNSEPNPVEANRRHARLGTIALAAMSKATRPTTATDWTALREVVSDIAKLDAGDYTTSTYANVLANLERAKVLLANPEATQEDADDLVFDLNLSLLGLERNMQAPISQQFMQDDIPTNPLISQTDTFSDQTITPNLLMSMMAGAYAGLATYRKSRLAAKQRRSARKATSLSKS